MSKHFNPFVRKDVFQQSIIFCQTCSNSSNADLWTYHFGYSWLISNLFSWILVSFLSCTFLLANWLLHTSSKTHVHYTNKLYVCIRCIMDNQAAMFTAQQMQYNKMYGMDPGRRMDELAAAQSQLRPGYGQHPWVKLPVFFPLIFCWLFFHFSR